MIIGYNGLEDLEYNKGTKTFFHKKNGKEYNISNKPCLNCRQEFLEEVNDPYPPSRFYCSPRCMNVHAPFVKLILEFVKEASLYNEKN